MFNNTVDKQKFDEIIAQVKTEGVSANDVISFENMIGSSFITSNYKLNRFTSKRSSINAEYVIDMAVACKDEIEKESAKYTILDVCKLADSMYYKVLSLSNEFERLSGYVKDPNNSEKIDRLVNEKWCYKWYDDRVIDLSKDNGVIDAFRFNRNYLQAVCTDAYSYECILKDIEKYIENSTDNRGEYSPLFSTVYNNSFSYLFSNMTYPSPKEFYLSIHNCLSLFRNYNEDHKEHLNYLISNIKDIKDSYDNRSRVFSIYDYKEITNVHNQLKNIESLINDELGTIVLDQFLRIFSK